MAGIDAFGTKLERSDMDEIDPTWTEIANATSIGAPELSREEYDVTTHQSPDKWEEIIFGIKRSGEVSVDVNYDPSEHDTLLTDFDDPNPRDYRLIFPDPDETTWEIKAGLKGFQPDAPHDGQLTASLTFKLSGKPELSSLEP